MIESENLTPQQERAALILNAATEQLIRWGYKRVTINDIAQHAGIGTGTVYLHWKNKEALFETVMLREIGTVWEELLERLRGDYREFYPHQMMRSLLSISMQKPIPRAIFLGDHEMLGKLMQSKLTVRTRMMATPEQFFVLLREYGLLKTDIPVHVQQYAFSAAMTGFCLVDPLLPDNDRVTFEESLDALAYVLRESFEPAELLPEHVMRDEVVPKFIPFFEHITSEIAKQLQLALSL